MKKLNLSVWLRRFLVYFCGLFIMSLGVVFSVKSSLGVSPVTCLANVTHQITGIALGTCTTATYFVYILIELLLLRRNFKPQMLLQILASLFFGVLVTLSSNLLVSLPTPEVYWLKLVYLLFSIPLVAFGVMLYLAPAILPTPGEGLSLALSSLIHKPVASCKMITDCCMVAVSAIISLLYFGKFVGVREGTVICALSVGFVMKRIMRLMQPALLRFVERETKLERAIAASSVSADALPGIFICIGREFGSGGYEIGKTLAERLNLPFYDETLIPLEAAESGLSEAFIRRHEQTMQQSLIYDFLTAPYAMYNEDLPPLEKLFAAQTHIIRNLAAEGKGGVIVGRCSDYILRDCPDCLRIFLHADPKWRSKRLAQQSGRPEAVIRSELERIDAARSRYYQYFTGRNWGDTRWFHLTIDTEAFCSEDCIALISEALHRKGIALPPS